MSSNTFYFSSGAFADPSLFFFFFVFSLVSWNNEAKPCAASKQKETEEDGDVAGNLGGFIPRVSAFPPTAVDATRGMVFMATAAKKVTRAAFLGALNFLRKSRTERRTDFSVFKV